LLSRLPRDSSITGEKHTASPGFAVHATIGPSRIRIPYDTIADVDAHADAYAYANANANANADANASASEV